MIQMVEVGKITLREAGEKIGVSYRQAKRIRRAIREKGMRGLIHGNRGRPAWNQISEALRQRVVKLSRDTYGAFNDTHFTEMLLEREGLVMSRERVRQIRRGAGIGPKRKRRVRQHRKRRERKAQEGLMVIWDGSPHLWFGPEIVVLYVVLESSFKVFSTMDITYLLRPSALLMTERLRRILPYLVVFFLTSNSFLFIFTGDTYKRRVLSAPGKVWRIQLVEKPA